MAENQKAGSDAEKAKEPTQAEEAETFSVEALIEGGQAWLGYSPHLVAGALSGQRKKHLTIDDAAKIVRRFAERDIVLPSAEEAEVE